ncbi:DUF3105 domain-containing protein [Nocardioides sp. GCM10027113]|uniref:DUF3105 domain-containing protein n=1 Tax=unclassified Nocardioides TaxID=2615069 RepID=UPI003615F53E
MAKPAKTDRQAVIDQIRNKQKGAEKRRGFAIVGVSVVIALLIIGAAAWQPVKNWWELRQFESLGLNEIGAAADVCADITTKKATGNAEHVPTGTPVPYEESPPVFGPHWNEFGVAPAPLERRLYTAEDRPELEALVHNLEHGYTILWFDETIAEDEEQMQQLRGIVDKFSDNNNMRSKFKAVPWTSEDGDPFPDDQHVALTHWSGQQPEDQKGVWQYCSEVSGEALEDFMTEYPYTDSPEPNAM